MSNERCRCEDREHLALLGPCSYCVELTKPKRDAPAPSINYGRRVEVEPFEPLGPDDLAAQTAALDAKIKAMHEPKPTAPACDPNAVIEREKQWLADVERKLMPPAAEAKAREIEAERSGIFKHHNTVTREFYRFAIDVEPYEYEGDIPPRKIISVVERAHLTRAEAEAFANRTQWLEAVKEREDQRIRAEKAEARIAELERNTQSLRTAMANDQRLWTADRVALTAAEARVKELSAELDRSDRMTISKLIESNIEITDLHDAAVKRAEAAERERDEARRQEKYWRDEYYRRTGETNEVENARREANALANRALETSSKFENAHEFACRELGATRARLAQAEREIERLKLAGTRTTWAEVAEENNDLRAKLAESERARFKHAQEKQALTGADLARILELSQENEKLRAALLRIQVRVDETNMRESDRKAISDIAREALGGEK